jgi:hypothetical protein
MSAAGPRFVNRAGRRHQGRLPVVDTGVVKCRRSLPLALAAFLLAALAAPAETFLVAVTETDDGEPSRPPLAAREGIFAALFDGDHVGFEVPDDGSRLPIGTLRLLAADAGAGTVAVITVDWHQERLNGGAFRVRARGSIVLVDALSGRETPVLPFAVGNEGREAAAGRPRLGVEIGLALIEAFRAWSGGR